jgi:hypothetical protein
MSIRSKRKGEASHFLLHPSPVYESREEESPSNSNSPGPRWNHAMSHDGNKSAPFNPMYGDNNNDGSNWADAPASGGRNGHNIWSSSDIPLNNAYFQLGSDADSLYSSSTYNSNPIQSNSSQQQGLRMSSKEWHPSDITRSMGQMNMGSEEPSSQHYYPGGLASVPSMASASGTGATVPGVEGASSGSTSGISTRSTSTWSDRGSLQQQFPEQHRQQVPYSSQGFHSDSLGFSGVPPGSGQQASSYQGRSQHGRINEDDSVSFDSRNPGGRGTGRNQYKGRNFRKNSKPSNARGGRGRGGSKEENFRGRDDRSKSPTTTTSDDYTAASSKASSEAIRMLMTAPTSSTASISSSQASALTGNRLSLDRYDRATSDAAAKSQRLAGRPILPAIEDVFVPPDEDEDEEDEGEGEESFEIWGDGVGPHSPTSKKQEWLLRMNRRMSEAPVGQLDPSSVPIAAIMNAWAKTKSAQGASMVELWLKRIQEESNAGNTKIIPNTKMYTMAGKFMMRNSGVS